MIPAFSSPAPTRMRRDLVGKVLSSGRLFLYEQCSLHITEKIPNSVYVGSRPRIAFTRSNSSGVRLCFCTNSAVISGSLICWPRPQESILEAHGVINFPFAQVLQLPGAP